MGDGDPPFFLLLPHCHHVLRRSRQRLRSAGVPRHRAVHSDGISHDEGWAVQFDLQVADGIILQLPRLILFDRGGSIERSGRCDAGVVGSKGAFKAHGIRRLNIFPEDALEALAASSFFHGARRFLGVKGAGRGQT